MNQLGNFDYKKNKKSWKFWLAFWSISAILLIGWMLFLQYQKNGWIGILKISKPFVEIAPISSENKEDIITIFDLVDKISANDQEKTYLLLFQNNMEIRPGGGYIGSFGILKSRGDKLTHIDVHDTNVFDSGVVSEIETPYPIKQTINIKSWELRDSNWSPDFPTNAEKAEFFYHLEGGEEELDGVVAISTDLLPSFLEITGPIVLPDYPGEYNSENAITKLEYQVERGYQEQGIEKGKRKYVMKDLANAIMKKISNSSWSVKKQLLERIKQHLDEKDVMIYFKDSEFQDKMRFLGWNGEMKDFDKDYLMTVDANLGALKTDLHMKRSIEYQVDLTKEKPLVNLKITYKNTARVRDWMTSNYLSYLRVYVPENAWFINEDKSVVFGKEKGKKYIGKIIKVQINTEKTFEFQYELPYGITDDYNLMIQKQSGVGDVPTRVVIIESPESTQEFDFNLKSDWKMFE